MSDSETRAQAAPVVFAVEWRSIESVTPWDKNPRKNDSAIPKVAASIRRFGFVAPIVVWASEGRIVAGHTRLAALQSILVAEPGYTPRGAPATGLVPVLLAEFSNAAEADAYTIADNRLAAEAEWDLPALASIVQGLNATDVSLLGLTGFDAAELEPLLRFGGFKVPSLDLSAPDSEPPPAPPPPVADASPETPEADKATHSMAFTDGQYGSLMDAVARWRKYRGAGIPDMSAPEIIVLLATRKRA